MERIAIRAMDVQTDSVSFAVMGDKYEEIKPQDEEGEGLWQQKRILKTE